MKIKYFITFFLIVLFSAPLMYAPSAGPAIPRPGTPEFDTMINEQMQSLEELLATQSESEREEIMQFLLDMGQEILNEATKQGYDDPFEYLADTFEAINPDEDFAEEKSQTEEPQEMLVKPPTDQTEYIKQLLSSLVDLLSSFRQKVSLSSDLSDKLVPFKYRLDDLVYFLNLFNEEQYVSYLLKKEFAELTKKLEELYQTLYTLNNNLVVPEFSLGGFDPYYELGISRGASQQEIVEAYQEKQERLDRLKNKVSKKDASITDLEKEARKHENEQLNLTRAYSYLRQKEEAAYLTEKILFAVKEATDTDGILDEFKKVLEAYKPEALKKAQEREKTEAEARKKQETFLKERPAWKQAFDMPKPASTWKPHASSAGSGGSPFIPATSPSSSGAGASLAPAAASGSTKPAGGKAGDKKPADKKDKGKEGDKKSDKKDEKESSGPNKGKKDEKGVDADVMKKVGASQVYLDNGKDAVGKNKDLLKQLIPYLLQPFVMSDAAVAEVKKYQLFFSDVTANLRGLTGVIKKTLDGFKDKKEQAKAYQEEMTKAFTAFQESETGKTITGLLEALSNDKTIKTLDKATNSIVNHPIDPRKRFFFFGLEPERASGITLSDKERDLNATNINYIAVLNNTFAIAQQTALGKKVEAKLPEEKKSEEKKASPSEHKQEKPMPKEEVKREEQERKEVRKEESVAEYYTEQPIEQEIKAEQSEAEDFPDF